MKKNIIYNFYISGNYIARDYMFVPAPDDSEAISPIGIPTNNKTLFKYIHPSIISDEEKRQVHAEVQNLVRQFPLSDICRYLRQMRKENRVYINVRPEAMFDELHRMGMPPETTRGFSYKNFMNYFNINE